MTASKVPPIWWIGWPGCVDCYRPGLVGWLVCFMPDASLAQMQNDVEPLAGCRVAVGCSQKLLSHNLLAGNLSLSLSLSLPDPLPDPLLSRCSSSPALSDGFCETPF